MSDKPTFGKRLKSLREKAGLTQEELAEKINLSVMSIRRWEWEQTFPRIKDIQRLAQVLQVSEDVLLNGAPDPTGWVLHVEIKNGSDKEELVNMNKPQSVIITSNEGAFIKIGGSYDLWNDDSGFKKLIADLKKLRPTVLQNGKVLGGIK